LSGIDGKLSGGVVWWVVGDRIGKGLQLRVGVEGRFTPLRAIFKSAQFKMIINRQDFGFHPTEIKGLYTRPAIFHVAATFDRVGVKLDYI